MNRLTYVTYQTFPANTANSLQTILNIKNFVKNNISVSLYFPLREKESIGDLKILQKKYDLNESFEVFGIKHYLPFGRLKIFKKQIFHLSHFLWSSWVAFKYFHTPDKEEVFMTRSEWVLYFLSKKDCKIIFECHQTSKIRNIIIKKLADKENILFIFLNDSLEKFYNIPSRRSLVLHNGVDTESFNFTDAKKESRIVYVGSLSRFGKDRNIEFLIDCYENSEVLKRFKLSIIGGPDKEALALSNIVTKKGLEEFIEIHGQLTRLESFKEIAKSKIGILINSSENLHSYLYTSPLKYFEYLYGGLNIVAVDFPAHRELPMNERIKFFKENDPEGFIEAIENSINSKIDSKITYESISLDNRVKNIISFVKKARLEGLEPPTL